jgi:lysophospholipase L1-like esterase
MEAVMKLRSIFSVFLLIALFAVGSASAQAGMGNHYLVLGDSVAFGYIDSAGYEYLNPTNFVPYADYVSSALRLTPANGGCPGETSSSFLSLTAPDHGCRAYRATFPLHVGYSSTQLAFATSYLKMHRDTRLVTIQMGANDGFILEELCAQDVNPEQCIANGAP